MKTSIYYLIGILLFLSFFISCKEVEIFVPAEEPTIEGGKEESVVIGEIKVSVEDIRDLNLYLKWCPVEGATSYEIVINDTMTIKDGIVMEDYLDYYYFNVANLVSDTEYKIILRAISKDLNVKTSIIHTKTKKSFIDKVINLPIDFQEYDPDMRSPFYKYINTSDGGSIIAGNLHKHGKAYTALIKMNKNYEVEWWNDITPPPNMQQESTTDLIQCADEGFLLINAYYIYKIDKQGNVIWENSSFHNQDIDNIKAGIELPDKSFLLIGITTQNWGQLNVGIEGLIVKMSPYGEIIWKKTYHSSIENFFEKIQLKTDGNLLIAGTKDVNNADYESLSNIRPALSVIEINQNGDILKEYIYRYQNDDPYQEYVSFNSFVSYNGCYYLAATAQYNFQKTFLTKIDDAGSIVWQRRGHEEGEYAQGVGLFNISQDKLLMLSGINSQVSILYELNLDGQLSKETEFRKFPGGYPSPIHCSLDDKGRLIYVTVDGQIIFFNLDGYKYE